LKRSILVLVLGLSAAASLLSCGGSGGSSLSLLPTHLVDRVLAAQGVSATLTFGALIVVNGQYDTLTRTQPLSAGSSPGLMAITPSRNIVIAFDANSNNVYAFDTAKNTPVGSVQLQGATSSMVLPTSNAVGFAAVPTAAVIGYSFVGAVDVMDFTTGGTVTTIAVINAQTVVSNSGGTQLLVFSNDSDNVTVLSPAAASPPVDTSCLASTPNTVCTILSGSQFSRPVNAVISGSTAYILNCGLQCGGTQPASVAVLDLASLTVTNTIAVDAATIGVVNGSTLYVAGTPPSPANNACTGQTWGNPPQPTAATTCGRLDVVDLNSMTAAPGIVITDGYHGQMDLSPNGQLFIGSTNCTNIGNVNFPSGEVRGCLSIYNTTTGAVVVPPNNGDVNGFQSFTTRNIEYVSEDGALWVYDTTRDILLINDFVPAGSVPIVGYVGSVKSIDFF